jgi:CRISPR-associated protein Csd2
MSIINDPSKKHDAVLLFEAVNCNPNGDPDGANQPRINEATGRGLVTDVAIKRKIRNAVEIIDHLEGPSGRNHIYIRQGSPLATNRQNFGLEDLKQKADGKKVADNKQLMLDSCFDVRMFGAVMSTSQYNAGQVRGPVQISFAESIHPIDIIDNSLTRVAKEKTTDADESTFGNKYTVPYGLYRAHLHFSPFLANQTGVTEEDLVLLWKSIHHMFELDNSTSKTGLALRGLYVFSHESALGNHPAHKLFDSVRVTSDSAIPASFADYNVDIAEVKNENVTLTRLGE